MAYFFVQSLADGIPDQSMKSKNLLAGQPFFAGLKARGEIFVARFKALQGDPHYIALGMGIGIFVGFTPTIPLHTVIALTLAFIFRGSKVAAAIGTWVSNPVTIPVFYLASYKAGRFFLGNISPYVEKHQSILELLESGIDVAFAMTVGGIIIGILPGVVAYFITRKIFITIRARKKRMGRHNEQLP